MPVIQWLKDGKTVASDDLQRIRQAKISRHCIVIFYNFKPQRALKREHKRGPYGASVKRA